MAYYAKGQVNQWQYRMRKKKVLRGNGYRKAKEVA